MTTRLLGKWTLVWLPDGRAGRVTEYDPERQRLTVGPLPWYIRAVRRLQGKPNRRAPITVDGVLGCTIPSDNCPQGHGTDV